MSIKQVDKNIWTLEKPLRFMGLEIGRRMTIVRQGSELVIISPVPLSGSDQEYINNLGQVSHILAPNLFHHLSIREAKELYPSAKLYAPYSLEKKIGALPTYEVFEDRGVVNSCLFYISVKGLSALLPSGIKPLEETVFLHQDSKSLIVTDLAFHLDSSSPIETRIGARFLQCYNQLRPSILEKLGSRDKSTLRISLDEILEWDFTRVIPAHGTMVEGRAKENLKEGFNWLLS